MRLSSSFVLTAALLLAAPTPAWATGVAPAQATAIQREQAQARFIKGKEKYDKKQYEEALVEFNASLDIIASPNTRLYVGRCHRELGRFVEAYVNLGRTEIEAKEIARDDPRYERTGQQARDERTKLEPKIGFVEVTITNAKPDTSLKVGNDEIQRGGWSEPLPVMPGETKVVVTTPGRAPIEKSVTVAATERKNVPIDAMDSVVVAEATIAEPASGNSLARNLAFVTGGAAVASLGLFAFFGIKANGTYSDLEDACKGAPCPSNQGYERQISQGQAEQLAANVSVGVFFVTAAATAALWLLSSPSKPKPNAPTTGQLLLRGQF